MFEHLFDKAQNWLAREAPLEVDDLVVSEVGPEVPRGLILHLWITGTAGAGTIHLRLEGARLVREESGNAAANLVISAGRQRVLQIPARNGAIIHLAWGWEEGEGMRDDNHQ